MQLARVWLMLSLFTSLTDCSDVQETQAMLMLHVAGTINSTHTVTMQPKLKGIVFESCRREARAERHRSHASVQE